MALLRTVDRGLIMSIVLIYHWLVASYKKSEFRCFQLISSKYQTSTKRASTHPGCPFNHLDPSIGDAKDLVSTSIEIQFDPRYYKP